MGFSKVLKFRELVEKLAQNNRNSSLCRLLNIHVPMNEYDELSSRKIPELLMSRLNNTWWEVSWPNGDEEDFADENATYKYVADNIKDLMRLKPEVEIPFWDMAYEFDINSIDDYDYDFDYYLDPDRFDTTSDCWEYLNYDLCSSI